jgi:hypothetical protein
MLEATKREGMRERRARRASAPSIETNSKIGKKQHADGIVTTQWTVKGIDKNILEASRVAARKRGMKFGAWVNQVLRAAAAEESEAQLASSQELLNKISEMESKLDRTVGALKETTDHIQHDVRVLHMLVPKIATS